MDELNSNDEILTCMDCGEEFIYNERERSFFEQQGWPPPKRCKTCQRKKKERHNG